MAELRIHDQSSIYFKSIRTGDTPKDINVKTPDKSGWLITDKTLQEILNNGANIASSQILKPDITETPLEHPEAYAEMLPIASYRTNDTFVGEHQATEWVASLVPDFSTIIDTTADPLFRDGWYPAVNEPNKKVYVKYRFISEDVCSPFSDALEFTTPSGGVAIPTLSVVEDGSTPLIKGSEFRLFGDLTGVNHIASSWRITKPDGTVIKDLPTNSEKLREYKVEEGLLQPETEYKISLIYHTNHPVFRRTRAAIGSYTTPASAIARPTLSFHTEEGRYEVRGTPFVVNSGTDRHKFTTWVVKNGTNAVIYTEENSKELTKLNLTGILEPDNDYRVTAIYIGDKSRSNEAAINFRTPTEENTDLNKLITLSKEAHGGVKLVMEKFKMPVAEKLLYLTWTMQNYNAGNQIAYEVRLDRDLDDKYDQPLVYDLQPADSWLKWLPNNELANPVIVLSAKGRIVGEKTVLNYSTQLPLRCDFDYKLGDMSIEDNDTLSPLVKIGAVSGADNGWIVKNKVVWELIRKSDGVKIQGQESTDFDKHRFINIDYATDYIARCWYFTNFGKYSKDFEFKSRPFTLPKPTVTVTGVGLGAKITATGANLNIPNHPEKSHGSTTWTLYSNAGTVLWQSIKNTTNLLSIDIPNNKLERATDYKVGVIFHSVDATIDSIESVVNYSHIGVTIYGKPEWLISGTLDNVLFRYNSAIMCKLAIDDGNGERVLTTSDSDARGVYITFKIHDGSSQVLSYGPFRFTDPYAAQIDVTKFVKYYKPEGYIPVVFIPSAISLDPSKTYKVTLDVDTYGVVNSISKNFTVKNNTKKDFMSVLISPLSIKYTDSLTYGNTANADKYKNSSTGGVFIGNGTGTPKLRTALLTDTTDPFFNANIDKRGTWTALRDYTGEWGNNTNRKKNNGDATNPANHFNWIAGQRVSKKGKLYEAKIDQAWNQYDPETDTSAWKEIKEDVALPSYVEILDCLGLNWGVGEGTNAFSYSDRKWSDGTSIGDVLATAGKYNAIKMISPTTKKVCFLIGAYSDDPNKQGITNMCWNDLVARQPEYTEVDRFTMRFGTELYYVRIPTKEELMLALDVDPFDQEFDSPDTSAIMKNYFYIQSPGVGAETVNVLSYDKDDTNKTLTYKDVPVNVKSRTGAVTFVLTPIPEGEEPYQTAMLNKLYPNMALPQGNLSWSTESLTEGPDTNYFPAGLKLAYDKFTDTGYFGRIPVGTFKSYKQLMSTYGVSGRTEHYDGTGTNDKDVKFYDMFYYHGLVVYIPNGAPWSNMSFDYCKSLGLLFGTNMGSYHSYVGDAKLEDSKDNWYRISGMNISRWNFTPTRSSDTSTLRSSGIPVYTKLNNNDIGWYLGDKSIYSDAYVKILKDLSGDTVHNNMYDKIKISGRLFDLKGNALSLVNINVNDTHRYNGEIQKDISLVNADGGNVQLRPNDLVRDGNNKIYIYNSDPSNTSSSFRPMLTLKPIDPGITNPIIFSGKVRSKCITRPYGWDRTSQLIPSYSVYNIRSIELALNVDLRGNPLNNNAKYTNEVLAGIVAPKAEENICIEYKTYEQKASANAYQLKVTFDNGKILYVFDALAGTGMSYADQDKTAPRIYRLSDLV